ncbi:MAG: ABC transporter permease [Opitutae bacterium]|nr:ABC transporter permease [Opitutae bacterium]
MSEVKSKSRDHWFGIRKELAPGRGLMLTVCSFCLPLLVWVTVSYVPFIWHPDIKLEISADREGVTTVFTAGDRVSKEFFPTFVEAVRKENNLILSAREKNQPLSVPRRENIKKIRHLAPLGVANGWLENNEQQNDKKLFELWKGLAEGTLISSEIFLSKENVEIIKNNWNVLSKSSPDFNLKLYPTEALLKLLPQGVSSNPVYLPAPHEVLSAGWLDFNTVPENGMPTMWERYRHSLTIIFWGFAYSCLLGIPLAILCGSFDFFSKLHEPFIDFFRYMPAPTFSVLFVAFLGTSDAPKIMLVFVGTFFQLVLVIANTTRLLENSMLEAAQTLGANRRQLLSRIILPGILPKLYNDLRILLGWAWTWLVIAELIGEKTGLTGFIDTQGTRYNFDRVFPVIILIGLTGFFTDRLLHWLRHLFFPWTEEVRQAPKGVLTRILLSLNDRTTYYGQTR